MLSKHYFLTAALGGIVVLGSSSLAVAQTLGPNGEAATPSSALTLTDAETAKLKEGKYSAALVWHTSSDFISAVTAGAIHEFDRAGIKVVATTDAGFDSARQLSDVETVMAKSPTVILALPLDPIGSAKAFQAAKEKGVKLVFLSNVPAGYQQGVDYVSVVTDDLFQMGKQAADALAKSLLNQGKVAWIFHDAAHALLTKNPELDGIYVTWAEPAEGVLAALRSAGNTKVKIVTLDLSEPIALDMARGGNVIAIVADKAFELGRAMAIAAGYGLLGKNAPAFAVAPALTITRENLVEGYRESLNREPPQSVLDALQANQPASRGGH
jgi:ribose transport system substrate-binding protein